MQPPASRLHFPHSHGRAGRPGTAPKDSQEDLSNCTPSGAQDTQRRNSCRRKLNNKCNSQCKQSPQCSLADGGRNSNAILLHSECTLEHTHTPATLKCTRPHPLQLHTGAPPLILWVCTSPTLWMHTASVAASRWTLVHLM